MTFMKVALECFIPSPAFDDVRPHGRSFGFESKGYVAWIAAKPDEHQIGRKIRQIHTRNLFTLWKRPQYLT